MNARQAKRKSTFRLISIIIVIVGVISYVLADRYWIEHVEITDVGVVSAATVDEIPSAVETTTADVETATAAGAVTADDWNYVSDAVRIAIRPVTTGSGNDRLTYFVADVRVTDATQVVSAFAENSFGRNIIEYTSTIAADHNAIFAINGDYYGFREDGIVIRNGVIYRDAPARVGLAFYRDGTMRVYDETQTSAEALLADGAWNTLSFGPALVQDGQIAADLTDVERIDGNLGNHSIQGNNPRTGVGIVAPNHFVFVVVDGRARGYSRGAGLTEFAQIFEDLGCTTAYNIDGGGSSTMVFMGRVVNNPLGQNRERGTSDILMIAP